MTRTDTILNRFGFTEQESEIYLAVLALDKPSVSELAKKVGKNRTAVYFHLKNLLDKGVLRETREGRKFRFVALPPAELAASFDRWTTEFKSLVPSLEALQRADKETPIIEIRESKRGYREVYDEISALPTGATFRAVEGVDAIRGELGLLSDEEWNTFFSRIVERNITTHLLLTDEALREPPQSLSAGTMALVRRRKWDLRHLPESALPLKVLMILYGKKVAFMLPKVKLVVIIEHAGIVGALTELFDALFTFAQRRDPAWS
jgi:predicted transcriptional regulator